MSHLHIWYEISYSSEIFRSFLIHCESLWELIKPLSCCLGDVIMLFGETHAIWNGLTWPCDWHQSGQSYIEYSLGLTGCNSRLIKSYEHHYFHNSLDLEDCVLSCGEQKFYREPRPFRSTSLKIRDESCLIEWGTDSGVFDHGESEYDDKKLYFHFLQKSQSWPNFKKEATRGFLRASFTELGDIWWSCWKHQGIENGICLSLSHHVDHVIDPKHL